MLGWHEFSFNFLIVCNNCSYTAIGDVGDELNAVIDHTISNPRHVVSIQVNDPDFIAETIQESIDVYGLIN